MELQEAIETRFSCRSYTDEPVAREQLEAILDAGRLAPTACNYQPQRIYVVTKSEDLLKLDNCTRCRFNAQAALIIGYSEAEAATRAKIDPEHPWSFGPIDASIVTTHMALKATELGLGSCWLGAFSDSALRENFDIPADTHLRAILVIGHPGEKGVPAAMHTMVRPAEETITWF